MIETPLEILQHEASTDAAEGFIEWRKLIKKPLTARAAAMVGKTLREITGNGGDADEALDLAAERGWQTVKASWYWNDKAQNSQPLKLINGGRNDQALNNSTDQRRDPALEQALRLAGVSQAQGNAFDGA
tara:strand:- start:285 stop:674 length:390 start_codon:yes stop_codon:yes gene_type:complete